MRRSIVLAISLVQLFSFGSASFAACEKERNEYNDQKAIYEKCVAGSNVGGMIGTIAGLGFAVPSLGVSLFVGPLVGGGTPALAAKNAHRIMNEKLDTLRKCEEREAQTAAQIKKAADDALIAQQNRQIAIQQINAQAQQLRAQVEAEFREANERFIEQMANDDIDVDSPAAQEVIRRTRADLENTLQTRLNQIESGRLEAISRV